MDAIPPATEQEAISRKMFRRQGIVPMASASTVVRRSPRRAANVEAPVASASKTRNGRSARRDLARASDSADQRSEGAPSSSRAEVAANNSISRAGPSGLSRKPAFDASEHITAALSIKRKSLEADEQNTSVQRHASYSPQPSPVSVRSLSTAGSPEPHSPWKQGKVSHLGREQSLSQFGLKPVKAWEPLHATQSAGPSLIEAVVSPPRREHHASAEGRRPATTSLAAETPSSDPVAGVAHQPTVADLRAAPASVRSLAGENTHTQKIRELDSLMDTAERRVFRQQQKTRGVQKLRIASEEHFFAEIKADARLANGSWTPPNPSEDTDEEEMAEVEEMTSREVDPSDLPEPSEESSEEDYPANTIRDERKRRADAMDALEASPAKRRRRSGN
ncbi:hypothetical protein TRAPUB_5880 [Trametes pubescens]|uniref:Uncharacterized protein n=1 Tax=Trametes pubescens TaxID=154538 RepID=A0A1M2V785_TRAPU|nr:hypothetical protein TRAPUB_5880 [Trametes pubescens]